jgi:predicted dehydrogenase/nucleoside-diphosphate-sugar epimerase
MARRSARSNLEQAAMLDAGAVFDGIFTLSIHTLEFMTGSSRYRLAIVGAGMAATTLHLPAALASDLVDVVALIDPAAGRAEEAARFYGLRAEIGTDIDEIRGPIDGAVIATPNDTHRALAVACAQRGIHCLVEKPLAANLADAEEICRAAEANRTVVAVGYSTRFRNEVLLLKQLLDCGYFGAIRGFYFQDGALGGWSPVTGYNLDRKASGGGVMVVVGTHFLDRMLYWFGYPDECRMEDDANGGPEAQCVLTVRYGSGGRAFNGTIRLSKVFDLNPGLVIDGEKGRVTLGLGTAPLLFQPHENPSLQVVLQPRGQPYFPREVDNFQLQLEDFVTACRDGRQPLIDGRQGLLSVRLIDDLYSKRSKLDEPGPDAGLMPASRPSAAKRSGAEPMRIGVFGSSGFVGSALVERLQRNGADFVALIHNPGSAWRLARHGLPLRSVDIESPTAVAEAMQGCTHVVNCTRGSDEVMINGIKNLLAVAKKQGVRRFVHLSSVAVYGDPPPPASAHEAAEARPEPGSYGALKLRQDALVNAAHNNGLSSVILCPPNITGRYSTFVCNVLDDLRRGDFALIDDGRLPLNVVDVENLCYAIELALTSDHADGRRIFVTDGDGITWRDFVDELLPLTELRGPLPLLPSSEVALSPSLSRRRRSVRGSVKHLVSSEVRMALRADPLFGWLERTARGWTRKLPPRLEEALRLRIEGPLRVPKVVTHRRFTSRYNAQQLRNVTHSCARATQTIKYQKTIDFKESMATFRRWYQTTRGMEGESWPLARELLSLN